MSFLPTLTAPTFFSTSNRFSLSNPLGKNEGSDHQKGPKVEIKEPNQVVMKVIGSGSNPEDWKRPELGAEGVNRGDDVAGVVHAVGSNVVEFKPGDRVAAFHMSSLRSQYSPTRTMT